MRDLEESLEEALSIERSLPDLYERWWGGSDRAATVGTPKSAASYHKELRGRIVHRHADGSIAFSTGAEIAVIPAGAWLAEGNDRARVLRRQHWTESSFEWRLSARGRPSTSQAWGTRLYVPAAANHSPEMASHELNHLASALDDAGFWFESKVRRSASPRSDHIVFWFASRDAHNAAAVVANAGLPERGQRPPPLTLAKEGLGWAADPPGGQSRGIVMCTAMLTLGDMDPTAPLLDRWDAVCESFNLMARAPWRHGRIDPFSSWEQLEADA